MSSFLCTLLVIGCCILSQTSSKTVLPKYKIDLDHPPKTRWREIGHDYAKYVPALRDVIKETIPPYVLPYLEKAVYYLDTLFKAPYPQELKGVAEAFNLTLPEVILTNLAYDLTAACTSIVAQDEKGNIYHARNLDYSNTELLRNMSINVDFMKNGSVAYSAVTFAGYVGILTGQKPFGYTVSLDQRDKGFLWENVFQLLFSKAQPVGFFLRSLLGKEESTFDSAIDEIANAHMIAPSYIIVGGVKKDEGVVVTRARIKSIDVWKLNVTEGRWFLVETNYDHWVTPPSSDTRRTVAIKAMNEIGQQGVGVKGLLQVLSTEPVMNPKTVFTSIMSAKFPTTFIVWSRECC